MREIIAPVTEEGTAGHGTRQTHPAYAQIGAFRVSGSTVLYGSDFQHNGFVTIRIKRSQLNRDLSHDWHFGGEELIEVALSEAQWATFVSSMNMGDGVPCTLRHLNRDIVPGLPLPSRTDQFAAEVDGKLTKITEALKAALAEVDNLGVSKAKAEKMREALTMAAREAGANIPFVAETFSKHMERHVETAKVEIHGYINARTREAGIELLQGSRPLELEAPKDDES